MPNLLHRLWPFFNGLVPTLERAFLHLTQPSRPSMALSAVTDLPRTQAQLLPENALLRQQLITLRVHRQAMKPRFSQSDRLWLVLLASRVQHWKDTLLILKPDSLLPWHHQGFRLLWEFKSRHWSGLSQQSC